MNQTVAEFESLWDKFIYSLRERLLKEREKQPLSYSICSLVLNDEKLCWGNEQSECGRWLSDYRGKAPVNGDLIFSIIMDNVRFSEFDEKKHVSAYSVLKDFVIPLVLAMVGFTISTVLHAPVWARFAATLIPEFIGFFVCGFLLPPVKAPISAIDDYISQIGKFKRVISDIISSNQ